MEWNFMSSDACMPWASFFADSTNHSPGVWTHFPVESASFHSETVQRLPMSLSKVSAVAGAGGVRLCCVLEGWRVGGVARRCVWVLCARVGVPGHTARGHVGFRILHLARGSGVECLNQCCSPVMHCNASAGRAGGAETHPQKTLWRSLKRAQALPRVV